MINSFGSNRTISFDGRFSDSSENTIAALIPGLGTSTKRLRVSTSDGPEDDVITMENDNDTYSDVINYRPDNKVKKLRTQSKTPVKCSQEKTKLNTKIFNLKECRVMLSKLNDEEIDEILTKNSSSNIMTNNSFISEDKSETESNESSETESYEPPRIMKISQRLFARKRISHRN